MDKPVIHVEHLSKQFKRHQALRDVTFSVAPGAIFGYLGPNGAGKTTTVRILLGLLSPTSGCAQLFGVDAQHDDPLIRQRIGVVLDQPGLYERLTAYDNLLFYARLVSSQKPGAARAGLPTVPGVARSGDRPQPRNIEKILLCPVVSHTSLPMAGAY